MKLSILIIALALSIFSTAQRLDTIDIIIENYNSTYEPNRSCSFNEDGKVYLDSIMLGGTIISKINKPYYLLIHDKNGILRKEGEYLGVHRNGIYKEYSEKGLLEMEGSYAIKRLRKPQRLYCVLYDSEGLPHKLETDKELIAVRVGTWKHYNYFGNIAREEHYSYEESRKEIYYFTPYGKMYRKEIYKKGKLQDRINYGE